MGTPQGAAPSLYIYGLFSSFKSRGKVSLLFAPLCLFPQEDHTKEERQDR